MVLTRSAQKFITPLTFQSLSQNPVHTDLFNLTEESEMSHIKLADTADLVLIAPATADLMAKLACGMADDLLTTLILVTHAPVLIAPSMNVNMWEKEVVQNNVRILVGRGYGIIEPEAGYLACGWEGKGRLAEPDSIIQTILTGMGQAKRADKKKSLDGKKYLINAGPTREFIDPVRFIGNPSSGKMGFALAKAAQARGAQVTLVTGPVQLETPPGVRRIDTTTAEEMFQACRAEFPRHHVFIATAAVGDYRPKKIEKQKIKKSGKILELQLQLNPDILGALGEKKKPGQIVVGFAAETKDLLKHAKEKLQKKKLDLIVANDVSEKGVGFESEWNRALLIQRNGKSKKTGKMSKAQIAEIILDHIEALSVKRRNTT